MYKNGKIILVEPDPHACGSFRTILHGLGLPNEVVCFSDVAMATEYLSTQYTDVFLVLQNAESDALQLPNSRNMIYMHEKFNIPEIACMFLILPHQENAQAQHTFVHTYYRSSDANALKTIFSGIAEHWKAQVFSSSKMQSRKRER